MQILKSTYDSLLLMGLSSHQSIQKYPVNARNLISLFIFCLNLLGVVGFLISGTQDLKEFFDSMFTTVTVSLTILIFINLVWNMRRLFEFLSHLEGTVNQSRQNLRFSNSKLLNYFFVPFHLMQDSRIQYRKPFTQRRATKFKKRSEFWYLCCPSCRQSLSLCHH